MFSSLLNYFGNKNNSISLTNTTPTLIASVHGRKVFGLSDSILTTKYCDDFHLNILPFKVKEIKSAGGSGEYICYWTADNKLLFSGLLEKETSDYFCKYNLPKEYKYINENMTELFEFKWKDFINKNKLLSNKINTLKQIYLLDNYCIIIQLDNDILFYYYLNRNLHNIIPDIIPVKNVKWIRGGIMSQQVYIYTNLNELFSFDDGKTEKVNLDFLQSSQNKLIRLAATTRQLIYALVTEDNKIYIYSENSWTKNGISHNVTKDFEYRDTPFEKQSKIIDIKGGFSHFVVLLENGKVYSIGFNNIGQLGMDPLVIQKTYEFNQIVLQTRENIFVDKIFVSSRGTILRTDTEFIFLGEVIEDFTKKNMIPNLVNSYILKRNERNRKWNEISCGPWNYLVYYKEKGITKGIVFYFQNLKNSACNFEKNLTHDIEIVCLKTDD